MPDSNSKDAMDNQRNIKASLEASRRKKSAQEIKAARVARTEARKWRNLFFLVLIVAFGLACLALYATSM